MKKGMSTSSIGLIAVLGVTILVGWLTYQNMAGVGVQERIDDTLETTTGRTLLETVKRTIKTDLTYASQDASLKIAAAGGGENCGYTGTRYWVTDGVLTAPTEREVLCSLSNTTLSLMNKFVDTEREQYEPQNVRIADYDCAGSYNPSEEASYKYRTRVPEIADAFQNSLNGGIIEVEGKNGQKDRYEGDIVADVAPNQFWPIYYTLYNYINEDMFNIITTSTVRAECTDDSKTTSQKIIDGVEEACNKLREEFCGSDVNCDIEVECEIECPDPLKPVDTSSCFDGHETEPFNKELCFDPKHTDDKGSITPSPSGNLVAQGTTTGSYRVRIDVIDTNHKIITEECKDCYLDWTLYIVDTIGTNCEVVD